MIPTWNKLQYISKYIILYKISLSTVYKFPRYNVANILLHDAAPILSHSTVLHCL